MGNAMVALKSSDEVKAVSAELAKNKEPTSFAASGRCSSRARYVSLTWLN